MARFRIDNKLVGEMEIGTINCHVAILNKTGVPIHEIPKLLASLNYKGRSRPISELFGRVIPSGGRFYIVT